MLCKELVTLTHPVRKVVAGLIKGQGVLNGIKDRRQLENVARDFEAILIGQFFRLMNKTISSEGFIKKSFERGIYEDMFHDELAKAYSKRGGLNLHRIIVDYFNGSKVSGRVPRLPAFKKIERVRLNDHSNRRFMKLKKDDNRARRLEVKYKYMKINVKDYRRNLINKGE